MSLKSEVKTSSYSSTTSSVIAGGARSNAYGETLTSGTIFTNASAAGSTATGYASGVGAQINAAASGSWARGYANLSGSRIFANNVGAFASGVADGTGGLLQATNQGSHALGRANGTTAILQATGNGSLASGDIASGGTLTAGGQASVAFGYAQAGAGSATLRASGLASMVHGSVANTGTSLTVEASGAGSYVSGSFANSAGTKTLNVTGIGAFFCGRVTDFATYAQAGSGSMFIGSLSGVASIVDVGSNGSGILGNVQSGNLTVNGSGAFAIGSFTSPNLSYASQSGAMLLGNITNGSTANATGSGSLTRGWSTNTGSVLTSSGSGSFTSGAASNNGTLSSINEASHILGKASGFGSPIVFQSAGTGSFVAGHMNTTAGRTASVSGSGSSFIGQILDFAAAGFNFTGAGSHFHGNFGTAATHTATFSISGVGVFASGYHQGQLSMGGDGSACIGAWSNIGTNIFQANGLGAMVGGFTQSTATISAGGNGSHARGHAISFSITASGNGSFAGGSAVTGNITASGRASFAWGEEVDVSAVQGSAFGLGHVNNTYLTTVIGRYSVTPTSNPSTWTATDPLFVVGNGASAGSRANAFVVLKDATVQFKGVIDSSATAVTGKGLPVWKKYIVNFNDPIAIAALTNDVELFSLPAYGIIQNVVISHVAPFDDGVGPMTAYTLSVGIAGDLTKYASAFDVYQAAGAGVGQTSSVADFESKAGATSIRVAATSVGANLNAALTGQAEIWVLWGTMQ